MNSGKSGQVPLDWRTESGRISLRRATDLFWDWRAGRILKWRGIRGTNPVTAGAGSAQS